MANPIIPQRSDWAVLVCCNVFQGKIYNAFMSCPKPGKHTDVLYSENVSELCFAVTGFKHDSRGISLKKLCVV